MTKNNEKKKKMYKYTKHGLLVLDRAYSYGIKCMYLLKKFLCTVHLRT